MSSVSNKAFSTIKKEFLYIGIISLCILFIIPIIKYFDKTREKYNEMLIKGTHFVLIMLSLYGILTLYKLINNLNKSNELDDLRRITGKSIDMLLHTAKKGKGIINTGTEYYNSRKTPNGNLGGIGAFAMGSYNSRLMPSKSEKSKASFSRDIYRENRDELEAEIYRERMAKQGIILPHDDGGYQDKKRKASIKKYKTEHPIRNKFENYLKKHNLSS